MSQRDTKVIKKPTNDIPKRNNIEIFFALVKLSRPKFLFYSALLHITGILLMIDQKRHRGETSYFFDWKLFLLTQLTISITHTGTHFWNEWADFYVDRLNKNSSSWTGGSKVLKEGILPRSSALLLGIISLVSSISLGASSCARYLHIMHNTTLTEALLSPVESFSKFPLSFILIGFSVLFVSIMYSVEPLRLSARGLGELCVSYVLVFATPALSFTLYGGVLDERFFSSLLPLFIINCARMIVMNIPDKEGDELGGKQTSVVLLGESKAQDLNTFLYLMTFLYVVPLLPAMPSHVRLAHFCLVPFRWWLSLQLNRHNWWKCAPFLEKFPFYESLFVVCSVIFLNISLLVFNFL